MSLILRMIQKWPEPAAASHTMPGVNSIQFHSLLPLCTVKRLYTVKSFTHKPALHHWIAQNSTALFLANLKCKILQLSMLHKRLHSSSTVFRLSAVFPKNTAAYYRAAPLVHKTLDCRHFFPGVVDRARHTGPSAFQRPINCKFNDQL